MNLHMVRVIIDVSLQYISISNPNYLGIHQYRIWKLLNLVETSRLLLYFKYNFQIQWIIMFCPMAILSLQTQNFPLYPLLSLPFRYCIQSIFHNVIIWYLLLPRTFFPFTDPSRASLAGSSFLASGPVNFFILSVHFIRSIFLHIHTSNASSRFCSFRRSVQVSAP